VARSAAAGLALVESAAARVAGRDLMLDVPTAEAAWRSILQAVGLRDERPFTRMYRSGAPPPGRPELILGAFGPELG
jgi:hypothetical protein